MSVNSDIEILLLSFERPKCLKRCLDSIKKYCPDIKVSVADDSRTKECYDIAKSYGHTVYHLPHCMGVAPKRNYLLERCSSEFFLVIDDDCYFTPETNFKKSVSILRKSDIDVLGLCLVDDTRGVITHWRHTFEKKEDKIHVYWGTHHSKEYGCDIVDALTNCFIAKTDRVREEGVDWDPDLLLFEAWSFFFRAKGKLKLGYLPHKGTGFIRHKKSDEDQDDYYKGFNPGKHGHFRKVMLDNMGVTEIIKHGRKKGH